MIVLLPVIELIEPLAEMTVALQPEEGKVQRVLTCRNAPFSLNFSSLYPEHVLINDRFSEGIARGKGDFRTRPPPGFVLRMPARGGVRGENLPPRATARHTRLWVLRLELIAKLPHALCM